MKNVMDDIRIDSLQEAKEILKAAGAEFSSDYIEKGRPRKLQVGQSHPLNPNLVWTDLGNGSYGWRSRKGKFHSNVKYPINNRKERRRRPVGAGTLGIEPRLKRRKNGNGKGRKRKEEDKPKS